MKRRLKPSFHFPLVVKKVLITDSLSSRNGCTEYISLKIICNLYIRFRVNKESVIRTSLLAKVIDKMVAHSYYKTGTTRYLPAPLWFWKSVCLHHDRLSHQS